MTHTVCIHVHVHTGFNLQRHIRDETKRPGENVFVPSLVAGHSYAVS